jgi:hypothetical protein
VTDDEVEHDDLPAWAKPLDSGPINVDETTTDEALTAALQERLAALLRLYNCEPTPDGWRALALRLALDHEIGGRPVCESLCRRTDPRRRAAPNPA